MASTSIKFKEKMDRMLEEGRTPSGSVRRTIRSIVSWDDPLHRPIEIYIARFNLRVDEEGVSLRENRARNRERYTR